MELEWDGRAAQTTRSLTCQEMLAVSWTPGDAHWREESRVGQVPASREQREGQGARHGPRSRAAAHCDRTGQALECAPVQKVQNLPTDVGYKQRFYAHINVSAWALTTKSWKPLKSLKVANIGTVK